MGEHFWSTLWSTMTAYPTIFIAAGVATAALVTGLTSLIISKEVRRRQIEGYALGASIHALQVGVIGLWAGTASTLPALERISIFAAFVLFMLIINLNSYGLRPWPWYERWVAEIAFDDSLTTIGKLKQLMQKWQTYTLLAFLVIGVVVDRNYWVVNS